MSAETYIVGKYNAVPCEPDETDPRGILWMWEPPRREASYILGVDPTNAINMPGWTRNLRTKDDFRTDNSAIEVFRVGEPDVQVAEWAGPLDAESLAVVVNFIGKLYGESQEDGQALTCIEMQPGNGWMTHRELVNRFGYHNYPPWIVESGGLTQKMTAKVGWYSSSSTRRDLWIRGANHLNKRKAILRSPWLVEEMVDCKPDNFLAVTARSMGGRHDDRVVAMLLAIWTAHEWAIGSEPTEPNTLDSPESKNWQASAISLEAMTDEWNDRFAQLLGDD